MTRVDTTGRSLYSSVRYYRHRKLCESQHGNIIASHVRWNIICEMIIISLVIVFSNMVCEYYTSSAILPVLSA